MRHTALHIHVRHWLWSVNRHTVEVITDKLWLHYRLWSVNRHTIKIITDKLWLLHHRLLIRLLIHSRRRRLTLHIVWILIVLHLLWLLWKRLYRRRRSIGNRKLFWVERRDIRLIERIVEFIGCKKAR